MIGVRTEDKMTMIETITIGEERITTGIIMIATTRLTKTEGETTKGTRNDGHTRTRTGGTRNVKGTKTTNATTEGEVFAENIVGSQIHI